MAGTGKKRNGNALPEDTGSRNPVISWRVHLLAENPPRAIGAVLVIAVIAVLAYLLMQGVGEENPDMKGLETWAALISAIIMFLALTKFFFPVYYTLRADGFEIRYGFTKKSYPWDRFKAFRHDKERVALSPFENPSWLRSKRVVQMLLNEKYRDEVIKFIKTRIDKDETAVSDTA